MTLPESLKILLCHGNDTTRQTVRNTLQTLGCEAVLDCPSAAELVSMAQKETPDLIMTGVDLPDYDGVSALIEISKERTIPAIVVTSKRSLEIVEKALQDHVMAYLMEPVNHDEIEPTIYLVLKRFEEFQDLREEVSNLRQALDDRKFIERAKGLLMSLHKESEEAAYKRLRRRATDGRIKLAEVAKQILEENENLSNVPKT